MSIIRLFHLTGYLILTLILLNSSHPGNTYFESTPYVYVSHIELTQGIQNETNTVPIIRQKALFARVYLRCTGCTSVPNINAYIHTSFSGAPGRLAYPVNGPITVYDQEWKSQRNELSKTLNFVLPPELTQGGINLDVIRQDTNQLIGGTLTSNGLTAEPLRIIYVPIRYKGQHPDLDRIQRGASWAAKVFPTDRVIYVPGTTLNWNYCLEDNMFTCPLLSRQVNARALLSELTTQYRLVNAYVYGWLPEGTFHELGGGQADPAWRNGRAAFGDDHPTEGPRIFAHEIGHVLGRRHTNTPCGGVDPNTDWPYGNGRIQEWGIDGFGLGWLVSSPSAIKNPGVTWDYMAYCGSLNAQTVWTSPFTYERIYYQKLQPPQSQLDTAITGASADYIIVSGIVYKEDHVSLDPSWVFSSTQAPANPPLGTEYCLELQDALNASLAIRCFDLDFLDVETHEPIEVDSFNLALPLPSGLARIVFTRAQNEIFVRSISANAPSVTLISPNGGEQWGSDIEQIISWMGTDPDGDELVYRVFYTNDGINWVPVGAATRETQMTIDPMALAGAEQARIRVVASDGLNVASDESDSYFTVEKKDPTAIIYFPEQDGTVPPLSQVLFQGEAYDLEDGLVPDQNIRWVSSIDGELGTGRTIIGTLSRGQHIITMEVTDSDGNVSVDARYLFAGWHQVFLPLISR
jgi:hypothetical protein